MMKAVALFGRKKASRPFKDYYAEWIGTLKNTLLPLLRRSLLASPPILLSSYVEMIHHHFQAYYEALDLAAADDVAQLLYPDWRNSLEKPFLWLGDFHPYTFTNLLRSFLDDDEEGSGIGKNHEFFNKPWQIAMAWRNPSKKLITQIEQIECGLKLMVPALAARARDARAEFIDRLAVEWVRCEGNKEEAKGAVGKAVMAQMEELIGVFVDANRLRRSVLAEVMSAMNVYQAALFYEGLAQFLVGFRDSELLSDFERCKMPLY